VRYVGGLRVVSAARIPNRRTFERMYGHVRERINAQQRARRAAEPERYREYDRRKHAKHREQQLAYHRAYYRQHRERKLVAERERRTLRRAERRRLGVYSMLRER
jgi:hypothetical protein